MPTAAFAPLLLLCTGLSLALTGLPSHAQSAAEWAAARQAEILQRQNQQRIQRDIDAARLPEPGPGGADTGTIAPAAGASLAQAGLACRDIRRIIISGASRSGHAAQQQIVEGYAGRCLGVAEIEQILAAITRHYLEQGLATTRAYLPSQDLAGGVLEIQVVEGVADRILLDEGARKSINPANVFPAPGALLNLRDFEQGIDQLNRLESNRAQLDILPGSRPGASDVLVRNTPSRRYHAVLGADNQGSDSTGRNQLSVSLSADRLLDLNELLLLTHRRSQPGDAERRASESSSLNLIVPLGYATISLSALRSQFVSTVEAPSGAALQFRGNSQAENIRLEQVLHRDRASRWAVAAMLTTKESRNYLAGQYLRLSSRSLSVLDLDTTGSSIMLGGVATASLGYARGLKLGGALRDADGLPDIAPRAQFGKFKLGFGYLLPFSIANTDMQFSTQFNGQRAQHVLYGSEQVLIGGIYSIRGFRNNTLSGDHGWTSRNEVSMQPALALGTVTLPVRFYLGVDIGGVSNRAPDVPGGRLAGVAVGLSASWAGVSVDLFNARRLSQPDFLPREASQTWLRLALTL
jgi:hemolysin activation/secretion protein